MSGPTTPERAWPEVTPTPGPGERVVTVDEGPR